MSNTVVATQTHRASAWWRRVAARRSNSRPDGLANCDGQLSTRAKRTGSNRRPRGRRGGIRRAHDRWAIFRSPHRPLRFEEVSAIAHGPKAKAHRARRSEETEGDVSAGDVGTSRGHLCPARRFRQMASRPAGPVVRSARTPCWGIGSINPIQERLVRPRPASIDAGHRRIRRDADDNRSPAWIDAAQGNVQVAQRWRPGTSGTADVPACTG